MKYFDKKGIEIKAGVSIMIKNDNIERVHDIVDAYGNADIGIKNLTHQTSEALSDASCAFISLSAFDMNDIEVLFELLPAEKDLDYSKKVGANEYNSYRSDRLS